MLVPSVKFTTAGVVSFNVKLCEPLEAPIEATVKVPKLRFPPRCST